MTVEQLKKSGWIIHECIVGSHLYGTNKEGSDTDLKGVYVLPTNMVLQGHYIEQVSDTKQDVTYYEIGRFIELAAKANPNILDVLGSDEVTFTTHKWKEYFPDITPYLTTKLQHTFLGYSFSQIKKAKGMNKKINWEKSRITRKTPLDFCYVLFENEENNKFEDTMLFGHFDYNNDDSVDNVILTEKTIGLASVNNFPDVYSMYCLQHGGGIISENSNDVQVRSIPKGAKHLGYLRFDRNAYSTHCKDYKEYQEWLEKRNPLRYEDNAKVDNAFDSKNMSHCVRLLYTAKDIALGKGLILNRPEKDQLIAIRNGEYTYDQIIDLAVGLEEEIKELFAENKAGLPREVNQKYIRDLLLKIRNDSR